MGAERWLLCALVLAAWVGTRAGEEWLHCARKPCVRDGQCVAEEVACPEGLAVKQGASVCGCCPGCVKPIEEGEECSEEEGSPCVKGTYCEEDGTGKKKVCTKGPCAEAKGHDMWKPRCEDDGTFSPVQCKGKVGNGRCFCWSPLGERLFGQTVWNDTESMNCACSIAAWRAQREGRAEETPHCTADGSFEALQCVHGACWCVDTDTGKPSAFGGAVPEAAVGQLFCYKEGSVGTTYWRRCDSMAAARTAIERLMEAHGATPYGLPSAACDFDGGFGPVQFSDDGSRICVEKDNSRIEYYTQESTATNTMNCNCARDATSLNNMVLTCDANGNYKQYQSEEGNMFCVDDDGYFMKFVANTDESCKA